MSELHESTEQWLRRLDESFVVPGLVVAPRLQAAELAVPRDASNDRLARHAEELLVELHMLTPDARDDTRRELAVTLAAVPDELRRLLGYLQADLEMLDGIDEPAGSPAPNDPQAAFVSSMMSHRYGLARAVLRATPQAFGEVVRADARGRVWTFAGFRRAAALFFDHAANVSGEPFRVGIALDALERAGRVTEAAERAEAFLAAEPRSRLLDLPAARALFLATKYEPAASRRARYERIVPILDGVIARLAEPDPQTWAGLLSAERGSAWMFRGHALSRLSRFDDALASFDQAVAADPRNMGARLSRGMLRAQLSLPSARDDLAFAIESGIEFIPAYVVLASVLLRAGELVECARICKKGLELDPGTAKDAPLRGMLDLALAGQSADTVAYVESAVTLATHDDSFLLAA